MRPSPKISVLSLLLITASLARPAGATEGAEAWKVPYQLCQDLIRDGVYKSALAACEQAYAINPEPGILVHIARIQTALVHPVQAHDALLRYLSGPLDEANRRTAEAQVRYLETLISTLLISTRLEGAEIRVDEQVMDRAALETGVKLPAGAHRVTLQAKGETFSRFIFLPAGERTRIELPGTGKITLSCSIPQVRFFIDDREVDAVEASSGSPRPAGSHRVTFKVGSSSYPAPPVRLNPDERVSVVCTAPPPPPASTPRPPINPRGYWVTGAGLALGVGALATAIYNGHQYDEWQTVNESLPNKSLPLAQQHDIAEENNHLMQSIETTRRVAVGLGVASALVTAGGVALLFADSAAPERKRASSWFRKISGGVVVHGALSSGQIAWRSAW